MMVRWFLILLTIALASIATAGNLGLRVYHAHEIDALIETPRSAYPECYQNTTVLQFPALRYQDQSNAVRQNLATNTITEEFIIVNQRLEEVTESTFDGLVQLIAAAEATGWTWGDILVYREPLFDVLIPDQQLYPGPWQDRRLIGPQDIKMLRKRLLQAYEAGDVRGSSYRICGLLYSWKNIGEAEQQFIREHLDGLYVELNSRSGQWQPHGNQTTIGKTFANPGHDFVAFGLPGTVDTAQMFDWCLRQDLYCGITAGANLTDRWFPAMFANLLVHLRTLKVNPTHPKVTYLLHHNRNIDDGKLLYFPEAEEHSMSWLINHMHRELTRP